MAVTEDMAPRSHRLIAAATRAVAKARQDIGVVEHNLAALESQLAEDSQGTVEAQGDAIMTRQEIAAMRERARAALQTAADIQLRTADAEDRLATVSGTVLPIRCIINALQTFTLYTITVEISSAFSAPGHWCAASKVVICEAILLAAG